MKTFQARAAKSIGKRNVRHNGGQAIIEGACGTVLMITVFVLLVMFGVNLYSYFSYSTKLQIVASETAKVMNGQRYWLGMVRREMNDSRAEGKAREYAARLMQDLGIPGCPTLEFPQDNSVEGISYTKVIVTMEQVPLPFVVRNLFPRFFTLSATGISSDMSVPPPAITHLNFRIYSQRTPGSMTVQSTPHTVVLPSFGVFSQPLTPGGNTDLGHTGNNHDISVGNIPGLEHSIFVPLEGIGSDSEGLMHLESRGVHVGQQLVYPWTPSNLNGSLTASDQ